MGNVLSKKLNRLLLALGKRVAGRTVLRHVYDAEVLARQKLEHVLRNEGISQFNLIKVRHDGRCVAEAIHPAFGKVAIKSWMSTRDPFKAQANFHLSHLIRDTGGSLFPHMHKAEAGYTIEEWTEGRCLAQMKPGELEVAPLIVLLDDLKRWSLSTATGRMMYHEDVEELVLRYVLKKMNQIKYGRRRRMMRRIRTMFAGQERLRAAIQEVQELAQTVELEQCATLMDIGPINLIQSEVDGRIRVIDYEQTLHGHYGFDAVYIMYSLRKRRAPESIMEALERHVFTATYVGSESAGTFFMAHYRLLNELNRLLA